MDRSEAIKLVRKYYPDGRRQLLNEALETLIPELKEVDDELIRKALIEGFKVMKDGTYGECTFSNYNIPVFDIIAWLERLGEKEYTLKSSKDEDVHKFVQYIERQAKAYELNLPNRSYDIYGFAKDILSWLEKESSQNLANSEKTCKDEPKFKVGDWIISDEAHEDYRICKITNVENGNYTIESIYGYKGHNTFETFEKSYHLWTIQDVKDGDVLAEHETIVLFKKIEGLNIKCYCTYHYLGYNPTFYVDTLQNKTPYHPATKEQCDLLFQKMKEAGYEWDTEKKELKKIKQKSALNGDDEKLINNVIELINDGSLDRDEKDFYIEKLESLKDRVQSNEGWTEEDEQTVRFYEAYTNNQVGNWPQNKVLEMKSKFNDWVKKVKYRVQPQWKPSKEQLTALEHVSSEYIGSWQPEMLTLFDDLKTLYDNYNKSEK